MISEGGYDKVGELAVKETRLLAWYRTRTVHGDPRDMALVWAAADDAGGKPIWAMAVMYCDPTEGERDAGCTPWRLFQCFDCSNNFIHAFATKPRQDKVYQVLSGFVIRTADECGKPAAWIDQDAWRTVFGEAPDSRSRVPQDCAQDAERSVALASVAAARVLAQKGRCCWGDCAGIEVKEEQLVAWYGLDGLSQGSQEHHALVRMKVTAKGTERWVVAHLQLQSSELAGEWTPGEDPCGAQKRVGWFSSPPAPAALADSFPVPEVPPEGARFLGIGVDEKCWGGNPGRDGLSKGLRWALPCTPAPAGPEKQ